ncbi:MULTISPECIES: WxL protein peptidoglycan domain-containing protein [unclassified Micromonospora]|uniref:WxL protein peptidoglycan domain-containing protein n=1 Tax=unclassified Micromonospora TaxID=2617518 RepID=UPI001B3982F8|nr:MULTISPECIES: DUF916 domain-containing protein [unclassified Micromonospora]MBQ1044194.1 DUF916 domain-containing protein [Micromonospora sp. C72]MBQ1058346.1 DUF916 domain-containing protein [Micromonospora sp. C32]
MHLLVTRRRSGVATVARTVALALLAAVAFAATGAAPARAADGAVTWTVRTASNALGADRSSFSYAVNPGGRVEDAMVVANRGREPLDLAVYTADGFTTDAGQLDLLTRDRKSVGIGAWVRTGKEHVVVPPGKTVEVPFAVTVPDNATPGDYAGGVVTSLTRADQAEGITVDRRLGIRIRLRISGALKPALAVEDLHVTYAGTADPLGAGDATVTYRIHNTGNAILSARQAVAVTGPFGLLRADARDVPAPPDLLPGESWTMRVPAHDVAPALRLAATVTLTPLLTDASNSTTALDPVSATGHGWAVPWTLLVLVVVLVAGAVVAARLARRNRARRKRREDGRVREAVEQALRQEAASR